MAAIKLPPRQRMINMMYLVLTAMLAMNVSKEVLDSFAILDADLVRSERANVQRAAVEYAAFADAAQRFPDRYGALDRDARRVRAQADTLIRRMERMKLHVMSEAEGRAPDELLGRAADGTDSLLALMHVEAKDDRDALTRLLVGPEPARPLEGPGTANALKRALEEFRDSLKVLCGAGAPELAASLDLTFRLDGATDASGTRNNWESLNFYDVPLAAGIAQLSKLQADVRAAENDVVKWLYRSATRDAKVMSDVVAAAVPRSSVVMVGDTFSADVFLAAYDAKNRPRVLVEGAGELPLGPDGRAKLRVKAGEPGEHTITGVIRSQGAKGEETYPYSLTYQVVAPLLVASPTKMNVLYRGVDNPVSLSVPGVRKEDLQAYIDNGTITARDGGWVARVGGGAKAHITVTARTPDGSRTVGPVEFRVKDLPAPLASVNGLTSKDARAPLGKLKAARGVVVKLGDGCEFNEPFTVVSYTLSLARGSAITDHTVRGAAFDEKALQMLDQLRNGDRVWVEEIKARLANGQGPVYDVLPIALKVVR